MTLFILITHLKIFIQEGPLLRALKGSKGWVISGMTSDEWVSALRGNYLTNNTNKDWSPLIYCPCIPVFFNFAGFLFLLDFPLFGSQRNIRKTVYDVTNESCFLRSNLYSIANFS